MLGGRGGTGGGIDCGRGETTGVLCDCRETTGGSFANTSRNIARKSSMLDFCAIWSVTHRYESCCLRMPNSRHEILPIQLDMDDKRALVDRHADQPSPSSLLRARHTPQAQPVGIGGVSRL